MLKQALWAFILLSAFFPVTRVEFALATSGKDSSIKSAETKSLSISELEDIKKAKSFREIHASMSGDQFFEFQDYFELVTGQRVQISTEDRKLFDQVKNVVRAMEAAVSLVNDQVDFDIENNGTEIKQLDTQISKLKSHQQAVNAILDEIGKRLLQNALTGSLPMKKIDAGGLIVVK